MNAMRTIVDANTVIAGPAGTVLKTQAPGCYASDKNNDIAQ